MPFFWFWNPPTQDVPLIEWQPFRSEIWGIIGIVSAVFVVLMVLLYRWRIRKFKIRHPADPFRVPSKPWWLGWMVWALIPAVVIGIIYWNSFQSRFASGVLPTWGSITAGFFGWAITLVAFQILLWIPGITPAKFLYHPRWLWRMSVPTRRPAVALPGVKTR